MNLTRFRTFRGGAEREVKFRFGLIRPGLEGTRVFTNLNQFGIGGERKRPKPVIRFPHGIEDILPKREAPFQDSTKPILEFTSFHHIRIE